MGTKKKFLGIAVVAVTGGALAMGSSSGLQVAESDSNERIGGDKISVAYEPSPDFGGRYIGGTSGPAPIKTLR